MPTNVAFPSTSTADLGVVSVRTQLGLALTFLLTSAFAAEIEQAQAVAG